MTITVKKWNSLTQEEQKKIILRSELDISGVRENIKTIINEVRSNGDSALREFTSRFDAVDLSDIALRVSEAEIREAKENLNPRVKESLDFAIENVRRFHQIQKPTGMEMCEVRPGILAGERAVPISSVGLYIPRGRGSFPSMLYMMAIPAFLAGVERICMVTPPGENGSVDPACLYTASVCGIEEIYRVGGAHAIAALAFGTESIEPVKKIVGPGSMYVTAAKRILYGTVDVGLPAGPSESIILADADADPEKAALDLLIEAEHGSDSQALLFTPSQLLAEEAAQRAGAYIDEMPEPRKSFLIDVFSGYGGIYVTESIEEGIELVNRFAPEHLQIATREPFETLSAIRNAGEVLLGQNTPFSAANYATGPNAVLPTGGTAHTFSAVSVRDFLKYSSVIHVTSGGYATLKPHVVTLADYEGFDAHAFALRKRPE